MGKTLKWGRRGDAFIAGTLAIKRCNGQCEKVVETSERKKILARKGLCFNCAMKPHRAADCPSKSSCQHWSRRHHSSICDKRPGNQQKLMTDGASDDGIFPVVVVKVNGVMCRALIDSGARSSYASANLVHMFGKKRVTSKKHFFRCE